MVLTMSKSCVLAGIYTHTAQSSKRRYLPATAPCQPYCRTRCRSRAAVPLSSTSDVIGTYGLCSPIPSSPKARLRWERRDIVDSPSCHTLAATWRGGGCVPGFRTIVGCDLTPTSLGRPEAGPKVHRRRTRLQPDLLMAGSSLQNPPKSSTVAIHRAGPWPSHEARHPVVACKPGTPSRGRARR